MWMAVGFGTHLYIVILFMTESRNCPKKGGTPVGFTSFARPYASAGDCAAGVPVSIHKPLILRFMSRKTFQRSVCAFLYADASSTTIRSKPPLITSSLTIPSPSKLMMTNSALPLTISLRLSRDPWATATVRCRANLNRSFCHAGFMIDRGHTTKTRLIAPTFMR